jgi:hypothetical protein
MRILPLLAAGLATTLNSCGDSTTGPAERPQFAKEQTCPDYFTPGFVVIYPAGAKADKNGNAIICAKSDPNGTHYTDDKMS